MMMVDADADADDDVDDVVDDDDEMMATSRVTYQSCT